MIWVLKCAVCRSLRGVFGLVLGCDWLGHFLFEGVCLVAGLSVEV